MEKVKLWQRYTFVLLLLSVFDAAATDAGIRMQLIREANPFAEALYEADALLFYAFKIVLPLILLVLLRRMNPRKLLRKAIAFATILYGIVAVYHIGWMWFVIRASI